MSNIYKGIFREIEGTYNVLTSYSLPKRAAIVFKRNLEWIISHSNGGLGISVSSTDSRIYPEVTGYLIPTLKRWGVNNLAEEFLTNLILIQNQNGSYQDPSQSTECLFDTGQVIRGLMEFKTNEDVLQCMQRAVKWIVTNIGENGEVTIPEKEIWGGQVPDEIILYSLEPALKAARILEDDQSIRQLEAAIAKILRTSDLTDFKSLNHFHAYILEALIDLGKDELVRPVMEKIKNGQKKNGWSPARRDAFWACSTGQFQYALICYKLGDLAAGDKFLNYGMRRQNGTGGWFGTLNRFMALLNPLRKINQHLNLYFAHSEIPWANKYFMDACYLRQKIIFEEQSSSFPQTISISDGRASLYIETVKNLAPVKLLDFGCGTGRYLKLLAALNCNSELHGYDISSKILKNLPLNVIKRNGTFYESPYSNEEFDLICAVESLEHAIHLEGAICEIKRILKHGGTLLVIDKSKYHRGKFMIDQWEQWFSAHQFKNLLIKNGFDVKVTRNIEYSDRKDKLFIGWTAIKL